MMEFNSSFLSFVLCFWFGPCCLYTTRFFCLLYSFFSLTIRCLYFLLKYIHTYIHTYIRCPLTNEFISSVLSFVLSFWFGLYCLYTTRFFCLLFSLTLRCFY